MLSKTAVVAPLSGGVSRLHVREGEMVVVGVQNQPGTTLMTVSDLSGVNAEVKVAEADVLLFITDAREGLTEADKEIARTLRKSPGFTAVAVLTLAPTKIPEERLVAMTKDWRRSLLGGSASVVEDLECVAVLCDAGR